MIDLRLPQVVTPIELPLSTRPVYPSTVRRAQQIDEASAAIAGWRYDFIGPAWWSGFELVRVGGDTPTALSVGAGAANVCSVDDGTTPPWAVHFEGEVPIQDQAIPVSGWTGGATVYLYLLAPFASPIVDTQIDAATSSSAQAARFRYAIPLYYLWRYADGSIKSYDLRLAPRTPRFTFARRLGDDAIVLSGARGQLVAWEGSEQYALVPHGRALIVRCCVAAERVFGGAFRQVRIALAVRADEDLPLDSDPLAHEALTGGGGSHINGDGSAGGGGGAIVTSMGRSTNISWVDVLRPDPVESAPRLVSICGLAYSRDHDHFGLYDLTMSIELVRAT